MSFQRGLRIDVLSCVNFCDGCCSVGGDVSY
jgi:hypothetical protein